MSLYLKKIDTFLRNKKTTSGYNTKENLDLKYLLEEAVNQKNEIDKKKLMSITFYQYLMAIYDSETVNFIKDSFGYVYVSFPEFRRILKYFRTN